MGFVRVEAFVANVEGTAGRELSFLVDTGAFYTVIPAAIAEELGIKPYARTRLTLADGRSIEAGVSLAYMKILDGDEVLPVVILELPEPLHGATALEGLGLRVDQATGRAEHSRSYGLALL